MTLLSLLRPLFGNCATPSHHAESSDSCVPFAASKLKSLAEQNCRIFFACQNNRQKLAVGKMKRAGKQKADKGNEDSGDSGAARRDGSDGDDVKAKIREVDEKAREMEEKREERSAERFYEKLAESLVIAFCLAMVVKAVEFGYVHFFR